MCGLVGIIIKTQHGFYKKTEDVLAQLLFVDQLRGEDSTGMIYVETTGDYGIMKEAKAATWSINNMLNDPMMKDSFRFGKAILGHNRKATIGKIVDETAHPFVIDNTFAMCHNGTLRGHKALADTVVDSEALAIHLKPHLGPAFDLEVFEEAMGKVQGAYALSAYNQENHTVYLMRNSERPLSYVETGDSFVYASEPMMLAWILQRNGYDFSKLDIKFLPEHTILSIDLASNAVEEQKYTPKKPHMTHTKWEVGHHTTTKNTHIPFSTRKGTEPVSKNEFKRLRAKLMSTRHVFNAFDYLEKNFPLTHEDGETATNIFGTCDDVSLQGVPHEIRCVVDVLEILGPLFTPASITEDSYHGLIYEMEYDKTGGPIIIYMRDVRTFAKSYNSKWNADTTITDAVVH